MAVDADSFGTPSFIKSSQSRCAKLSGLSGCNCWRPASTKGVSSARRLSHSAEVKTSGCEGQTQEARHLQVIYLGLHVRSQGPNSSSYCQGGCQHFPQRDQHITGRSAGRHRLYYSHRHQLQHNFDP
eukprot:Skav227622  [mRNA]  locus=scaffold1141:727009:728915:+ [translate_table: standard]